VGDQAFAPKAAGFDLVVLEGGVAVPGPAGSNAVGWYAVIRQPNSRNGHRQSPPVILGWSGRHADVAQGLDHVGDEVLAG